MQMTIHVNDYGCLTQLNLQSGSLNVHERSKKLNVNDHHIFKFTFLYLHFSHIDEQKLFIRILSKSLAYD